MAGESLSTTTPNGKEVPQRFADPYPLSAHYIQQRPEYLLWECKARLEFLTHLATAEPTMITADRAFPGFAATLRDTEMLLGVALEKMDVDVPS